MTEDDEQRFKTMHGCHICGEKYNDKDVRIRDHCHITGKFRDSAHQECMVYSLSSGKGKMFHCAACHAFTPHVNAWKHLIGIVVQIQARG